MKCMAHTSVSDDGNVSSRLTQAVTKYCVATELKIFTVSTASPSRDKNDAKDDVENKLNIDIIFN